MEYLVPIIAMVDTNSKMFHDKVIGELVLKTFLWHCKLNIPIFVKYSPISHVNLP